MQHKTQIFRPLTLPNGAILKNRIVKSAMSDSLGDGRGNPTVEQMRLYERWALGGVAASIVGEVQGDARFAESTGNLVLDDASDRSAFAALARRGGADATQLWLQLGHAGALTRPEIGPARGPSALDLPGLTAAALTLAEIRALPARFARTAWQAQRLGFAGVQIHAAHGFVLSQFLSPLFNRRADAYGGSVTNRMRLLIEVIAAVRDAVSPGFTVAVKLNASDQIEGGFETLDALQVIRDLDDTGLDLIEISGGTYFPGTVSSSERASIGPYFLDFAGQARQVTSVPLMVTGGFKTRAEVAAALSGGAVDAVGLARALVLDPSLVQGWQGGGADPDFPRFPATPPGGMTAWYTMRLAAIAGDQEEGAVCDPAAALQLHECRNAARLPIWTARRALAGQSAEPAWRKPR